MSHSSQIYARQDTSLPSWNRRHPGATLTRLIALTLGVFLLTVSIVAAPVESLWSYTSIEQGYGNSFSGLQMDKQGNIWVLGRFSDTNNIGRLELTKLDGKGNEIWRAKFEDGSYLWQPRLALSSSGDSVFGATSTNGTTLVRFDAEGNRRWQTFLMNPDGNYRYLASITFDSEENIWITGTQGTYKLNPGGGQIWSKINLLVKGLQPLSDGRMAALKDNGVMLLTTDGEVVWQVDDFKQLDPYIEIYSYAAKIAVDDVGSIFVGGMIVGAGVVAKYGLDGKKLWQTECQGRVLYNQNNPDDFMTGLRIHPSGAVYFSGGSGSPGVGYQDVDFLTMKLDADGGTLWRSRERQELGAGLAIDSPGNAYSLGYFATYTNNQSTGHTILTKYDANGSRLWTAEAATAPAVGALLLTDDGNLLVYGGMYGTNMSGLGLTMLRETPPPVTPFITKPLPDRLVAENDSVTLSVSATGNEPLSYQWQFNDIPIDGATSPQFTIPKIRVDQTGDYSVELRSGESSITSSDATVTVSTIPVYYGGPQTQSALIGGQAQFGVGGFSTTPLSFQWLKDGQALAGATNYSIVLTNLQPAQDGLYHATVSSFAGSTNSQAARLRVFTSAQQVWKVNLRSTNVYFDLGYPARAAVDSVGNFVVSSTDGGAGSTVLKLDSLGKELWRVQGLHVSGMALDANDNLYFAGSYSGTNQIQIGKLSPAGLIAWQTNFAVPTIPYFYVSGFGLDQSNNVLVAGLEGSAFRVFKCDSDGKLLWTKTQIWQEGAWAVTSLAVGPEAQIYVVGLTGESIRGSATLIALAADGQMRWSARLGNADYWPNYTAKAVVDTAGNVSVFFSGIDPKSYSLVSYDSAGKRRWKVTPVFADATFYAPVDLAASASGELTAAGYVSRYLPTGIQNEWITTHFDKDGHTLWLASFSGDSDQRISSLKVDGQRGVYVSGGYGTFHYDEKGVLIWQANHITGLAVVDTAGNFYSVGTTWTGTENLIQVAKYQSSSEANTLHFESVLPSALLIAVGDKLELSTLMQSSLPLRFQWTINGVPLTGQTNATIHVAQIGEEYAGRIGLEIYGPSGLIAFPQVSITVATKPVILEQPRSTEQVLGGDVRFTVLAKGTSPLSYQWLFNGNDLPGETNSSLILAGVDVDSPGDYSVKVFTLGAETVSEPGRLLVYSNVEQTWVKDLPASAYVYRSGQHVTLDNEGNVYVLGATGASYPDDFTVLRYSPSGTLDWSQTYPLHTSAGGGVAGFAWDRQGGLIIVGSKDYAADAAIVKMTTSGAPAWQASYSGPDYSYAIARAVAVDSRNNVYVTGDSMDIGRIGIFLTIKLDPQGRQIWVQRVPTELIEKPGGRAIAVDARDRIYVAGNSGTLRYDTDGQLTWSTLGYLDQAIAVDTDQNVFVVGKLLDTNAVPAFVLRKYNSAGDLVWSTSHRLLQASAEPPHILLFGDTGSTFVAGQAGVFKFDANGRELWSVTNFEAAAAARYRSGVVATGNFVGESAQRYLTQAFDSDGHRQWLAQYQTFSAPSYWQGTARGVGADAEGRVYVTGSSGGTMVTIRYSPVAINEIRLFAREVSPDGNFRFALHAPLGRSYRIQTSADMVQWKDWLAGRTVESDTFFSEKISTAEGRSKFYRAIVE